MLTMNLHKIREWYTIWFRIGVREIQRSVRMISMARGYLLSVLNEEQFQTDSAVRMRKHRITSENCDSIKSHTWIITWSLEKNFRENEIKLYCYKYQKKCYIVEGFTQFALQYLLSAASTSKRS